MQGFHRDVAGPCLAPRGSVVCIGAFDGVHAGHRAVLARVRERAAALGLAAVAITFEPIPREFFTHAGVPRLAGAGEKVALLRRAGADAVLSLRFDAALAAMEAEDFIRRVLVQRVAAREVWVGEDFRFGHRRRGDLVLLREAGATLGFGVAEAATVASDGLRVSSTRIRALLAAGEFAAAAPLLGRAFAIGGHVVRGQQLGRRLGYPTANVRLGRRVAPLQGIFAVRVRGALHRGPACAAGGEGADIALPGVASLGVRPTVNGGEPLLEAHLFDFDGDLYGRHIDVEFVAKIRDEEKFDSLDALTARMRQDAEIARTLLHSPRPAMARA